MRKIISIKITRNIIPLILTAFLDLFSANLIVPILAPIIADSNILPTGIGENWRNIIFGLFVAIYPIVQFIAAPILGTLSDHYGRKKILILSLTGTIISHILNLTGLIIGNFAFLIIARFIDGITGGNISIVNSSIADISNKKNKTNYFGLIGMAMGLGLILGPFIGGHLADPGLIHWFNEKTPFALALILVIINTFILIIFFKETLKETKTGKIKIKGYFSDFFTTIRNTDIEQLALVGFLFIFGINIFIQILQLFLSKKYGATEIEIGNVYAFTGIWIVLSQGIIVPMISKIIKPVKIIRIGLFVTTLFLPFIIFTTRIRHLYLIIPILAIINGIMMPNFITLFSNLSPKNIQGEVLGIVQSIQAIGFALGGIFGGLLLSVGTHIPIYTATIIYFIAWIIFKFYFKLNDDNIHQDN